MVRPLSALGRALRALRSSVTAWVLVLICTQTNVLDPSGEKGKGIGTWPIPIEAILWDIARSSSVGRATESSLGGGAE